MIRNTRGMICTVSGIKAALETVPPVNGSAAVNPLPRDNGELEFA